MVLWVLWLTYGSFYFCRTNISAALPGIEAELHYTKAQLGTVLMALKLAYGIGQFINGQLAERCRPRTLLAIGLLASAALNVMFGWFTALYFLTFVWACNGYVQALGWPPTMRVAANWFLPLHRGRAIGIIGTGYQVCGVLSFFLAGWAAKRYGWRGALYLPAILVAASALHMLLFLRDTPDTPAASSEDRIVDLGPSHSFRENLVTTLSNPSLWLVAAALYLLDACRYGFTDWGISHLAEVLGAEVNQAAYKLAILPAGGIVGALVAGWTSDRFFRGRRPPVICALLLLLGLLTLAYNEVLRWGPWASSLVLFGVGFCIYGPQVLLVGTLPVDLARRGTAAAAVGFVNFMGYMGAAAGDKITGHLAQDYGWQFAVRFWAGCALMAALIIAGLWNAGKKKAVT